MTMNNPHSTNEEFRASLFDLDDSSLVIPLEGNEEEITSDEQQKVRFYGFELEGIGLLLDGKVRSEVVEGVSPTPVPLMPSYLVGLYNMRGNLVPIYDLLKGLGINSTQQKSDSNRILLLDENEDMVGMVIKDLLISLRFDELDQVEDMPSVHDRLNEHIKFCYKKDGKFWYGFDHITLFESL